MIAMLCISRFLIGCFVSDVRNNVFLNCKFAKLLKYKSAKFWTTFLQLGVYTAKPATFSRTVDIFQVSSMSAIPINEFNVIIANYSYECIGTHEFCQRHNLKNNPCYLAPTTAHVSLFKGATIVGIGRNNLSMIPVDINSRMDTKGIVRHKVPVES